MLEKDQEGKNDGSSKFDSYQWQINQFTYEWQFYSEKHELYFKHTDDLLYEKGAIFEGQKRSKCVEVQLFKSPEKPRGDFHIRYTNWLLYLRVKFFKEVFNERAFVEGFLPQHKFKKLVIPQDIYFEILNVINEFDLLHIRDLLLEVIASAQEIYIRDVAFWEIPENQKLITSAESETAKAIKVIEQSGVDIKSWRGPEDKFSHELDHIKFVFNTGTIKLEHKWLAREFVESMKRAYDERYYKDWKKDLARYPARFEENAHKSSFKYRLAISYYNLFSEEKFFEIPEGVHSTNKLLRCITKLLEFSFIYVSDKYEPEYIKIKSTKNWLKRNIIEPNLTYAEVPADLEKLEKYFDLNFLEMANAIKRTDAISIAFGITHRFDIPDLLSDFAHIASCIKEANWIIGHQMTSSRRIYEPDIPEMDAFRLLMNGIKGKKKLTYLKFIMEGKDGEHELSSRLPLFLIEKALRKYYEDYQVEFDTDVVPTSFKRKKDGSIEIEMEDRINLPHQRFIVRLVHSLYNYLEDNSEREEGKTIPVRQFYEIIAVLFRETGVFYLKYLDERSIIKQIEEWHHLNLES